MAAFSRAALAGKPSAHIATRRMRRAAVNRLIEQLELIKSAEERYRDSIPENLRGSSVFDRADESVAAMDEAAEILASVYMVP